MAKATFVKKARKPIYRRGVRVEADNKNGYRIDTSQPHPDGDILVVERGASYYWWQFMNQGKHYSLTPPHRSELTQSGFLSQLYDLQDKLSAFSADVVTQVESSEHIQEWVEEFCASIDTLKEECEESMENIPENLQESPVSELLQERIQGLEEWKDQLESVSCEVDDEEIQEQAQDDIDGMLWNSGPSHKKALAIKAAYLTAKKREEIAEELSNVECPL